MRIINAQSGNLSFEHLEYITNILDHGGIIIFPTETVYGLMCRYGNILAKKRIFGIKNRSKEKKLQCLISNISVIKKFNLSISPLAEAIINNFFPGPLTLILEDKKNETFGFRMPKFPLLNKLLDKIDYPLWATSANISGEKDILSLNQIIKNFSFLPDLAVKNDDFLNQASTVISVKKNNFSILRCGKITEKQLNEVKKNLIK